MVYVADTGVVQQLLGKLEIQELRDVYSLVAFGLPWDPRHA